MNINVKAVLGRLAALTMLMACSAASAGPQTTFFNYQGQLQDNGHPANGNYDLAFELYDDSAAGNQVGGTLTSAGHSVSGGLFSIGLNFGSTVFDGTQLWLQVYVNTIPMTPRTAIRLAPVAEYALTSQNVVPGSITASELATDSVTRSKLAGSSVTGNISFSVGAGNCGILNFSVSGAQVGDVVVISWASGVTPPTGIIFGPASVTAAGAIKASECNLTASNYSTAGISVTVQTFR
jgi:hypothetical protein